MNGLVIIGGLATVCFLAHFFRCVRRPNFSSHCLPHNAQGTVRFITVLVVSMDGSMAGATLFFFGAPVAFAVVYRFGMLSLSV